MQLQLALELRAQFIIDFWVDDLPKNVSDAVEDLIMDKIWDLEVRLANVLARYLDDWVFYASLTSYGVPHVTLFFADLNNTLITSLSSRVPAEVMSAVEQVLEG